MFNPFPPRQSRLGFHYFPDSYHYRDTDLQKWLVELVAFGASWLVLRSPSSRAIPEFFIKALIQTGIEPILQFDLNPSSPPRPAEISTLLDAYSRWGVHGVILFDRPNTRAAWPSAGWAQQGLVDRYLDNILPLSHAALQSGLTPLFPTLEPGGSYWDTAFLRATLESLSRRKQAAMIENLVLTAYGWTHNNPLNWGAGGPGRWPAARPYFTPNGIEDQRGFRIFEWYESICRAITGVPVPIILLGAGAVTDPNKKNTIDPISHERLHMQVARLMAGKKIDSDEGATGTPVPDYLLCANLWLLSADPQSDYATQALFQLSDPYAATIQSLKLFSKQERSDAGPNRKLFDPNHPIEHYLLLPTYEWGVADWHLDVIRPFVKRVRPVVGFSIAEARLAREVTVIANQHVLSDEQLDELRHAGCKVRRINGDGTSIATQLAER